LPPEYRGGTHPHPVDQTLLKKGNYLLVAQPEGEATRGNATASAAPFSFGGTDLLSGEKVRVSGGATPAYAPAMLIRLGD
jgi:hypothetical protein